MTAAEVEPSFLRQHAVRFCNGVVVDSEIDCELTHGWERIADRESARHQECTDGVGDLTIRRNRGSEINLDDRDVFHCMLSTDNRQGRR